MLPLALAAALINAQAPDEVLGFVSENLAKGNGNFFSYYRFADLAVTVQPGDVLVYEILLDPKNPAAKGGVDVDFDQGDPLRDMGLADQSGIRAHSDGVLTPAVGKWYTRRIALDAAVGRRTTAWQLVFEGDENGRYAQFVDNVRVERKDGTVVWVYQNGLPSVRGPLSANGYSKFPSLAVVERARLAALDQAIADVDKKAARFRSLEQARQDIDLAREFLKNNADPHLQAHLMEATAALDKVERNDDATPQDISAALHTVQHALKHTHPEMEKYTGHLVGHAHIDLMWLWEWQEGIVATHDTFRQAVKFMDEFPGFTFSQSSSVLYKTIEENYPALFKDIQKKVKKGQWELVGGRVDEGDTNMISPESHARHFLYGQRYFRERFGKTARVGWEPDTFGHTIQMPQILKMGGIDSYYFCRGGKGKPLFWWQGLDGTKMLSFEEPATGSWYNSDLSYKQFQEILDFQKVSGSKDMLWVYGVGNHGGGPTREMIQQALAWMKDPTKPKVKFSTATEFFDKLRTYNLSRIPVVKDELNPVFEGCYTTHSEVKQLNRHAEYATTAAEALAASASFFGFEYPRASFRRNWEDITFNHHHDTLPGSFVHPASVKSKTMLRRVIADDQDIMQRALETMSLRVTPKKGGLSVMVYNPTGWKRSGWVETYAVTSGWSQDGIDLNNAVAEAPDGKTYPLEVVDSLSRRVRIWAAELPAYGYRVFHMHTRKSEGTKPLRFQDKFPELPTLSNPGGPVDPKVDSNGWISSLTVKKKEGGLNQSAFKDLPIKALGRLELHHEAGTGMSAWVLGKTDRIEVLSNPKREEGRGWVRFTYQVPSSNNPTKPTTIAQTFRVVNDAIDAQIDCDWNEIGNGRTGGRTLRVAFETGLANPTATYEVPFGALARPTDGKEVAGLNWQDLSDGAQGITVLNDGKSGMSADGSTMRLTLVRSSYDPDPAPDLGKHTWRYRVIPHDGPLNTAEAARRGYEFQMPLLAVTVPFDAQGNRPLEWSPLQVTNPTVVPTGLKLAEDGTGLILRMYEAGGVSSQGTVDLPAAPKQATWVNFVEDPLGLAPKTAKIPLALKPWEIRTIKWR